MQTEQKCCISSAHEAAAKIQAGFRGYRVRKKLQEQKLPQVQNLEKSVVTDRSKKIVVHHQEKNKDKEDDMRLQADQDCCEQIGSDDERSTLEDKSATKIQAGVRGFLVRKRQQAEAAAATRIQAGFRGFRTRKLLKQTGQ